MIDPIESAEEAGLKYVTDEVPGFKRKKKGKGFVYLDEKNAVLKKKAHLDRIKELVIPPAWRDVWICRSPRGHLQVTGRDARNRKQYRYHPKWNEQRNETKFNQLLNLSKKIPLLKKQLNQDLSLRGMPKEKVLATVIKVMLITKSRVGNSTYAEENESYGLTTLLNKHAKISSEKIRLSFRGKSGVDHDISFKDPQLSKIVKKCQELPGQELFAYHGENGEVVDVTSTHVNEYLKKVTGEEITAKDLRTWGGTCKAIEILVQECPEKLSEAEWKQRHVSVVKETARLLHNTVSVCRKYYIHPIILEADKEGTLHELWKSCRRCPKNLEKEENLLLKILSLNTAA